MGILTHVLKQTAIIVETQLDKHGSQILVDTTSVACKFRYITELDTGVNKEGATSSDAIVWFEPTATVAEGTLIKVDDLYWRINRVIKARKLSGDAIHFLKALVNRHKLAGE